jgi:hypothetical protein
LNNYNHKNPTFSFRIERYFYDKLERIAKKEKLSTNEKGKQIIDKYLKGELVPKQETKELELQDLKIEKMKEEIRYLKIKNDFAEEFDKPLSNSGRRILTPQLANQTYGQADFIKGVSPYDANNKRLQCVDCGILITWDNFESYLIQIKEYKNHILSKHNREFSPLEKDVIDNLKYEGKSK